MSRSPVATRMRKHDGVLTTSILVAVGHCPGARRSRRVDENPKAVDELLAVAAPVDFTREYARIGVFATPVVARALARDLILVAQDVQAFGRVVGLRTDAREGVK